MTNPTRRESLHLAAMALLSARCERPTPSSPRAVAAAPGSSSRRAVAAAAASSSAAQVLLPEPKAPSDMRLWYRRPAREWVEALPLGSGRLGAMVFGGVESERIQLNEDTLWAGGPYHPENPDALGALDEVRRLIFEGRYREAEDTARARMMARPIEQMAYQTAGDLILAFSGIESYDRYERELSLETAIARTTFVSAGAVFTREVFASPADQVIVARL